MPPCHGGSCLNPLEQADRHHPQTGSQHPSRHGSSVLPPCHKVFSRSGSWFCHSPIKSVPTSGNQAVISPPSSPFQNDPVLAPFIGNTQGFSLGPKDLWVAAPSLMTLTLQVSSSTARRSLGPEVSVAGCHGALSLVWGGDQCWEKPGSRLSAERSLL